MGNELLTQTGNISGAAASTVPASYTTSSNTGLNTAVPNSLLNIPKDYSNDMMMPDWLKTGNLTDEQRASIFGPMYTPTTQIQYPQQAQTQYPQPQAQIQYPQPQIQNPYAPAFNGQGQVQQPQYTQEQLAQYYEKLLAQNPNLRITEKGNLYEVTNTGKKTGIFAGIGAALADGIAKVCKGKGLKEAFSLKSLALKVPVFAIAFWAVGSIVDSFINGKAAQQADAQTQNA
jgi:hypothetical protein